MVRSGCVSKRRRAGFTDNDAAVGVEADDRRTQRGAVRAGDALRAGRSARSTYATRLLVVPRSIPTMRPINSLLHVLILFPRWRRGCGCTSGGSAIRSGAAKWLRDRSRWRRCVEGGVPLLCGGLAVRRRLRDSFSPKFFSAASQFDRKRVRDSPPADFASRNSSSDSFSSKTSSSNSGGACCFCSPSLRMPSSSSRYSTRATRVAKDAIGVVELGTALQRDFFFAFGGGFTKLSGCSFQLSCRNFCSSACHAHPQFARQAEKS